MATSFTTHSAGQVIASADINLIQTAVNTLENATPAAGGPLAQGYLRASDRISNIDFHSINNNNGCALNTGQVIISFFTASISKTVTTLRWAQGTASTSDTAASGWALYSVDASDNMTRLVTALGATIFASTGVVTAALSASQALVAGSRYAIAALHVDGSGTPITAGMTTSQQSDNLSIIAARSRAIKISQTSLPSSITGSTLTTAQPNIFYVEIY